MCGMGEMQSKCRILGPTDTSCKDWANWVIRERKITVTARTGEF